MPSALPTVFNKNKETHFDSGHLRNIRKNFSGSRGHENQIH
jgi:hypothetical protein